MPSSTKSLRLLMPQWQGGNDPVYYLGAQLLAWLAPRGGDFELVEVPVGLPDGTSLKIEQGILGKTAILLQNRAALKIIEDIDPERIVTFGGDCSVSLAPFSYMAAKYAGDVAVLWIDAHFDLATSKVSSHAHSYPMLNLLGQGDAEFAAFAKVPIPAARLAYVGIDKRKISERSRLAVEAIKPRVFSPDELTASFAEVADWAKETGASKLLVHFDLDVIDPSQFRAQLFNNPAGLAEQFKASPTGTMSFETVVGLLLALGEVTDIIALTIAEHLPWDAENLRKALARLPILSG
ncbi:arginase family protein [Agrobacterium vitis]|uniref:arginase family protein n=1 Tax=Agrobacterium vitis TaxID=373 RepID=UPI00087222FF|nr:arginase family protein [Agrobacterium vitis]MCE6076742.1 arginase family protein [Agrobacterium vitis]MCM2452191.1 arginase family protein [Agrobacterium vitis]MCM2471079.1 arginase family protein [Agrobacterium vitis]MUO71127.1 arginase family protein [Agrobacterium vitis]MUO84410.1 arginase family protein [Agrobacterium vitis]